MYVSLSCMTISCSLSAGLMTMFLFLANRCMVLSSQCLMSSAQNNGRTSVNFRSICAYDRATCTRAGHLVGPFFMVVL